MVSHALTLLGESRPVEARATPPELLLRKDRSLRFQRNGKVYATDGRVGSLRRVVVDEAAGAVAELIVMVEATGQTVVLPVDLVEKTGGSAIFLTVDRARFAEQAGSAPIYEKRRFKKARLRTLRKPVARAGEQGNRLAVARIGADFLETPIASRFDPSTDDRRQERRGTDAPVATDIAT